MWKNAGQATDDNMAHAHCMLDKKKKKNAHYLKLLFHKNNGYAKARQWCVLCTLSAFLIFFSYNFSIISSPCSNIEIRPSDIFAL
jgi:hypothetical protein